MIGYDSYRNKRGRKLVFSINVMRVLQPQKVENS